MAMPESDPGLADLRERFAANDLQGVRQALPSLSKEGRRELTERIGAPALERMMQNARRARGGARGRVVVLHGILGGKLASVRKNDEDLVWLNYLRLLNGRIGDFALDDKGNPKESGVTIVSRGLLDEYLPLVMELDRQWKVLPFAYDWRLDIESSADALATAITTWSGNEPVHLVAHSMGGLVSRCFIKRHPDLWRRMADDDGLRRGGRLVMLGTPNRGSFAIPFVLTGEEKTVKMLARLDLRHDLQELLGILNTFPGSYQMLPSPRHLFDDDRVELYSSATWGSFPVSEAHLERGRSFQEWLDDVIDPARLLYVAGYDQPTPYRVRVDGPGRFSYRETFDGDGRVPHELGLLPGVASFYVREKHGDLQANARVLAGIHDLLATGKTAALDARLPVGRALQRSSAWLRASEIAPIDPAIEGLLGAHPASGRRSLDGRTQRLLESALIEPFLGASRGERAPALDGSTESSTRTARSRARRPVTVELVWGDLSRADGDVYVAGHYQGVLPQAGELALDRVVSGLGLHDPLDGKRLVITERTKRGKLRGEVGDVSFYPWTQGHGQKIVAIAGMGHPGTFAKPELQRLARSLLQEVGALPGIRTVNMLLIGSGNGNLAAEVALDALFRGFEEAMAVGIDHSIQRIRIVESDWRKVQGLSEALRRLDVGRDASPLRIVHGARAGEGGSIGDDVALSAILSAMVARKDPAAMASLLRAIPRDHGLRDRCREMLDALSERKESDYLQVAERIGFGSANGANRKQANTARLSLVGTEGGVRAAVLTDTAVVPERAVSFDWKLIEQLVAQMTDPRDLSSISDLSSLLAGFVLPRDFRELVALADTLIVEVDRKTAPIHFEMLGVRGDDYAGVRPIGLEDRIARQLRTSYSPPPSRAAPRGERLRALVIGDAGDPGLGYSLPGARREAIEVVHLLRSRGVEVDALVGTPDAPAEELTDSRPATVLEVLRLLQNRTYDLLHYAGHGDFVPEDPEHRAGWIIGAGYFTSRELGCVDKVPALVVANACLSAQTSDRRAEGGSRLASPDDTLLPGLVDEFLKRGVRNYVGTAWEVSDEGAVLFAKTLYGELIPGADSEAECKPLGEALLIARKALKAHEDSYDALWAAYQHYGDPTFQYSEVGTRQIVGDVSAADCQAAADARRGPAVVAQSPSARRSASRPAPSALRRGSDAATASRRHRQAPAG